MLTVEQFDDVHRTVDRVYAEAEQLGWSLPRLAAEADLTYTTVWRLKNMKTLYPRFQTVYQLAKAVGLCLKIVQLPPVTRLRAVS